MKYHKHVLRTARCGTAIVLAAALLSQVGTSRASAHWGACGSDPKLWLSDETALDVATTIQADASAISNIAYTVHIPTGMTASKVVYTNSSVPETVDIIADQHNGFQIDVVADANDGSTYPVTIKVHDVNQGSTWATASGATNSPISADLNAP